MSKLKQKIKDLKRFKKIVSVFVKYRFGFLFDKMDIPLLSRTKDVHHNSSAERLRLTFEELGTTFIKFGQIMSTRPDIFPDEYIQELEKLQDSVPPFAFHEAKEILETEFNSSLPKIFAEFEPRPIASASISQVHRAVLHTGEIVAVKIQRPNIQETIETDLDIFYALAGFVAKKIPKAKNYNPSEIIKEFDKSIHQELNFVIEADNLEKFKNNFTNEKQIDFPFVYRELTTEKVLTMEFIEGTKVDSISKLKKLHIDLRFTAKIGAIAFIKQVFLDGFFHADPHAGNIFVQPNGKIVFLDCGMVGHITEDTMLSLANLFAGIADKDTDKILSVFDDMGVSEDESYSKELRKDVQDFVNQYANLSLQEIELGVALRSVIQIITSHELKIPANLAILIKAVITIEGVGRQLDPEFNMIQTIKPFTQKLFIRQFVPKKIMNTILGNMQEIQKFISYFPHELNILTKKLCRGTIKINIEHKGLENTTNQIQSSLNILSFSLLISALIVGSSLIVTTDIGKKIWEIPILGLIGFGIATFMSLVWLIVILHKKRKKMGF
ncbi:AarF/ABC1/UbiB kinase family protein [Candidatus Gracilibacteria bacterium]|nr:AarF/ABC1/UbiB kinase family protein [Candidatus Gracilibacteria bacterium]